MQKNETQDYHFLITQSENFLSQFKILDAPDRQKLVFWVKFELIKRLKANYEKMIGRKNPV